jgi:hypothetical protein
LIKTCNLLVHGSPYRTSKLQEKPLALKTEHPALKKMKFINFFHFFVGYFALLDPDPDMDPGTPLNPDPLVGNLPTMIAGYSL